MQLSDFDYTLPDFLIAQRPVAHREDARLMVLDRSRQSIRHRVFGELGEFLAPGDIMVLNNTKVVPARLIGRRISGGKVELLLLRRTSGLTFEALVKPARLKLNEKILFNGGTLWAVRSGKGEVTFGAESVQQVYAHGSMPLPPYVKRPPELADAGDYQTVYASEEGSVAAPTAGLHFTPGLLEALRNRGIKTAFLTLHIGYATFRPVKCEDITRHKMEPEYFSLPEGLAERIRACRDDGKRLVCVGTTTLRALESYFSGNRQGWTDLFIYPGYRFEAADCLLTNFHLPRTTLFMLACAFAGADFLKRAYREAIAEQYRFYSYGDAMLII